MRKFTLFLSLFVAFATAAMAQIADVSELSSDKCYAITAKDANRGALYAGEGATHLSHCGATYGNYHNKEVAVDATNPAQQFAFVQYDGKLYLYSVSEKKFAVKDGQYVKFTENPEGYVTVEDADVAGYFIIKFNGANRLNFSGGYTHGVVANYETPDDGNRLVISEAGAFDATEALAVFEKAAQELEDAKATYEKKFAEAFTLLLESGLSVEESKVALQATDAEAAAYVTCPQEHNANNSSKDGDGVPALFDGNTGTFMHTSWGVAIDGPHYLQIDLGEANAIQNFSFNYHTRVGAGNDFPDAIEVQGSNDGEYFTTITKIESGLPQSGDKAWTSGVILAEEAYTTLRFLVTAERTYFHMSEFALSSAAVSIAEGLEAKTQAYLNLKAVAEAVSNVEGADLKTYNAYNAALTVAIADVVAEESTLALIEEAKALLDFEGVGYPTEAPRAKLQAAIEVAASYPVASGEAALKAAMNAYCGSTDIVLPEAGKTYTLTMVAKSGKEFYLNYNAEDYDIEMVERKKNAALPQSAVFFSEANEDGTIALKTYDGNYLVYHSKYAGVNWLENGGNISGLQQGKDKMTSLTFAKMENGNKVEAVDNIQIFGLLTWYSLRGLDTGKQMAETYGYMVLKADGSDYDGASVPFWNDNYSSAFRVEEVELLPQTAVLDFSVNNWGIPTYEETNFNGVKSAVDFTDDTYLVNIDPTANGGNFYYDNNGFLRIAKPGSKIVLPAFDFPVGKIEVVGHSSATSYKSVDMNVYVGTTAVSTACVGSTATNTFEIAADNQAAGTVYELVIGSKGGIHWILKSRRLMSQSQLMPIGAQQFLILHGARSIRPAE